jgi:hypothetical protein
LLNKRENKIFLSNQLNLNILSKEEEVDHLLQVVEEDQEMAVMLDEKDDETLMMVEREYLVVVNEKDLVVVEVLKKNKFNEKI